MEYLSRYGFNIWSLCKGLGLICVVLALYQPGKYFAYQTHTLTNTPYIKPIPWQILHILNPYLDKHSTSFIFHIHISAWIHPYCLLPPSSCQHLITSSLFSHLETSCSSFLAPSLQITLLSPRSQRPGHAGHHRSPVATHLTLDEANICH